MGHGDDHQAWVLYVDDVIGEGPEGKPAYALRHFRIGPEGADAGPLHYPFRSPLYLRQKASSKPALLVFVPSDRIQKLLFRGLEELDHLRSRSIL